MLNVTGFSRSPLINYLTLTPRDHDQADAYAYKHRDRINNLIRPWFIIASLLLALTSILALFGVPGMLFMVVRSILELILLFAWWQISKRTQSAGLYAAPAIYLVHNAYMILITGLFFAD